MKYTQILIIWFYLLSVLWGFAAPQYPSLDLVLLFGLPLFLSSIIRFICNFRSAQCRRQRQVWGSAAGITAETQRSQRKTNEESRSEGGPYPKSAFWGPDAPLEAWGACGHWATGNLGIPESFTLEKASRMVKSKPWWSAPSLQQGDVMVLILYLLTYFHGSFPSPAPRILPFCWISLRGSTASKRQRG